MTRTEKFVSDLCKITFLPIWSFPNPIGKKGKELCDILIVCGNDIIIISIKEIDVKEIGNPEVEFQRWLKKAIDESVSQIYGAERYISSQNYITLKDGNKKIVLPKKIDRNIHRIAVAFGRGEKFPLKFGDFGKGFVHVFDENSIQAALLTLDTITDFLDYIRLKESFISSGKQPIFSSELDLLGLYILNNNDFPNDLDVLILHDDIWDGLMKNKDYEQKREELKTSYVWDNLIKDFHENQLNNTLESNTTAKELEMSVRMMAKESRANRKVLSDTFLEFIGFYDTPKACSRIVFSEKSFEVIYLFLLDDGYFTTREARLAELQLRCLVAKSIFKQKTKIIGIATERYSKKGYSLDLCYMEYLEWNDELENIANKIRKEHGFFLNINI